MANYALIPDKLTARYKIGTGFLAPTVTQLYSDFEGLGARQVPNYNLKPETSLNQELELEWDVNDALTLVGSGYLTKYDDFIHTKYWRGETGGCNNQNTCLQSVNLDQAKVAGLKLGVSADLSNWLNLNGRFVLSANYHTARDSATVVTDNGARLKVNTLAATPTNLLLGAGYTSPEGDWQLNARMNVIGRKKAEDTKFADLKPNYEVRRQYCNDSFYAGYCSYGGFNTYDPDKKDYFKEGRTLVGYSDVVGTYEHVNRSKTAVVYDIYGSKKFGKKQNFVLNAGVYNIFNEKYIPWESLRQFHNVNTNNMVDSAGYGFNRYTAPGRNYAVSLTYEF